MLSRRICKICDQKIYIVSSKVLYCCFKAPEDNVWYRLMVMLKLLKDLIVVKCICWPWQAFPCLLIRQHVTFYLSSLWRATVKNTKYIYKIPPVLRNVTIFSNNTLFNMNMRQIWPYKVNVTSDAYGWVHAPFLLRQGKVWSRVVVRWLLSANPRGRRGQSSGILSPLYSCISKKFCVDSPEFEYA